MKLNVGDTVRIKLAANGLELTVQVEDASKSDIIQAKVTTISDKAKNESAVFTYEAGKVYEFLRKDICE